jgi:hypothetical protein
LVRVASLSSLRSLFHWLLHIAFGVCPLDRRAYS